MNLEEVRLIQSIQGYPAVSILLPTHRAYPDNQQDSIRVKNLIKEAANRLLAEFSKREVEALLKRLEEIANQIDYRNMLDGLAIYVNQDFARLVYLPFALKERIEIGAGFSTRDLVYAINRTPRYWVLALSEQPTRLYEGVRDTLVELQSHGFPLEHSGPGGSEPLPGGFGIQKSAYRDERHRQFFRQIDSALGEVLSEDPLPVVLVGVDRYIAFFQEVSRNAGQIAASLTGSHAKTSPVELAKLAWPLAKANIFEKRILEALDALNAARNSQRIATGPDEVWFTAQQGRGDLLLVEQDFHYPAQLDASGQHLIPATDPTAPGVMEDAVDALIEMVLSKGGRVVFVENSMLTADEHIALVLRY